MTATSPKQTSQKCCEGSFKLFLLRHKSLNCYGRIFIGKGLLATLTFVIGLLIGGIGGGMLGIGSGAGIGIATGLSAGVCGIANAAQQEGLLTEEQVDQVFNRAVSNLRELTPDAEGSGETIVGAASECDAVLQKLRDASAS